ncbi:MAG: hypothetical protein FWD91_02575 [Treponema sp.]|nr:hypothetical protein [Treponema sp.]
MKRIAFKPITFFAVALAVVIGLSVTGCSRRSDNGASVSITGAGEGDGLAQEPIPERTGSLAEKLQWLRSFAQDGGSYTIELDDDDYLSPDSAVLPTGKDGLSIVLRGIGGSREIRLSANGNLFVVEGGVTLVLDENITLVGRSHNGNGAENNNNHLVRVNSGGMLIMNEGSKLTGNANQRNGQDSLGGGIYVASGGTFILDGGEISGNAALDIGFGGAGAVHVRSEGRFDMLRGTISGNIGNPGGVFVGGAWNNYGGSRGDAGVFRMGGGVIYGSDVAGSENILESPWSTTGSSLRGSGIALYGTFNNGDFSQTGTLPTPSADFTIRVENGILLQPERAGPLEAQLSWLRTFAQDGGTYTIELTAHESTSSGKSGLPEGRTDLTIILRGRGEMRTISLPTSSAPMFLVYPGVTLVLDENITLVGDAPPEQAHGYVRDHLVGVAGGGTLIVNEGAKVTGHIGLGGGGGIHVGIAGTLILNGGEISGNSITENWDFDDIENNGYGGGVRIERHARFDMLHGTISDNGAVGGGGVHVAEGGVFRMGGGVIYGSDAGAGLANRARREDGTGAALSNLGTAEFGIFDETGAFSASGNLATTNSTIQITGGNLQ